MFHRKHSSMGSLQAKSHRRDGSCWLERQGRKVLSGDEEEGDETFRQARKMKAIGENWLRITEDVIRDGRLIVFGEPLWVSNGHFVAVGTFFQDNRRGHPVGIRIIGEGVDLTALGLFVAPMIPPMPPLVDTKGNLWYPHKSLEKEQQ